MIAESEKKNIYSGRKILYENLNVLKLVKGQSSHITGRTALL